MKMSSKKLLPLALVILTGAVGGVLRGYEWAAYYDNMTGLYESGPVTYLLLGFSALILLCCLALTLVKTGEKLSYLQLYRCSTPGAMLTMLGGVIFLAAGVLRAYGFLLNRSYSYLLFGVLTILCGAALIALAVARKKRQLSDLTKLGAVALVYWAAFMLIQVFMEHPVEPEEFVYLYDLLAMCFSLLAVYAATAQVYGRERAKFSLFTSLCAVFLLIVSGFGRMAAVVFSGRLYYVMEVLFRLPIYVGLAAYLVSNAASLLLHYGEAPEASDSEAESVVSPDEEDTDAV